jgi:uncharacterized protein with gpF-like domain
MVYVTEAKLAEELRKELLNRAKMNLAWAEKDSNTMSKDPTTTSHAKRDAENLEEFWRAEVTFFTRMELI